MKYLFNKTAYKPLERKIDQEANDIKNWKERKAELSFAWGTIMQRTSATELEYSTSL